VFTKRLSSIIIRLSSVKDKMSGKWVILETATNEIGQSVINIVDLCMYNIATLVSLYVM